ncbi:NAD-dependent epimerase/dehydratase family protein [Aquamicrobium sp. LC103]|uniref:NAD-dependent epimerase/dehydratase family protein n=1 Tax=Aquamicrobium sp. LC103 TaxID=1120658 RepID=UPI001484EDBC|nr:NAD-dependent epimerase/dehydratase family protein [Aquamicrobium sp. LC103]
MIDTGRILVTGATGFVGKHVVGLLLASRRELRLAVRSIEACPAPWRDDGRIEIVETGDIETSPHLDQALQGVSAVVHLAGLAHVHDAGDVNGDDPFLRANALATERLVQAAVRGRVDTFINLSSLAAVTGNASSDVIDDATRGEPTTNYGRSKRLAEEHVVAMAGEGMFAVSLRPPLIVGAEAKGNWASLQRLAATGLPLPFASVDNRRSMIGVDTVAEAVAHLCSGRFPPEAAGNYCIADPESLSLSEIVTELRAGMGMPPHLVPFPTSILHGVAELVDRHHRADGLLGNLVVDATRFHETFDVRPRPALREAIRKSGMLYGGSRPASVADAAT